MFHLTNEYRDWLRTSTPNPSVSVSGRGCIYSVNNYCFDNYLRFYDLRLLKLNLISLFFSTTFLFNL